MSTAAKNPFVTAADADDDESASLDTADREEREEERQNADQAFTDTVGEGIDVIDSAAFGDLIESMGTTYCEEEHRRTIKKISGADGKISRDAFIAWPHLLLRRLVHLRLTMVPTTLGKTMLEYQERRILTGCLGVMSPTSLTDDGSTGTRRTKPAKSLSSEALERVPMLDRSTLRSEKNVRRSVRMLKAFTAAAGEDVDVLAVSAFSDLIESMGTTYCEEEHRRTIKKISSEDGATISRDAFVAWYLDWLFGGDESDIESDEGEDDEDGDADGAGGTGGASSSEGWGGTFGAAEEGSWKCDACMVRNKASDAKCAACETARPGYEAKAAEVSSGDGSATASSAAAFASEIGTGGFSFGGGGSSSSTAAPAPASSSSIGAGGFSFGGNTTTSSAATPAPAFGASSAVSSSSSGGGFAFGAPATAAPAPPSGVGGGGFTFGVKPAVTSAASDKVNGA